MITESCGCAFRPVWLWCTHLVTALLKLTAACTYTHYVIIRGYLLRSWVRLMPENALCEALLLIGYATQYSKAIDEVISISRRAGTFFVKTSMILCLSTFTGNMSQLLSKVSSDHTWQLTNVEVTHWFLLQLSTFYPFYRVVKTYLFIDFTF